jgi:hypothetical protein
MGGLRGERELDKDSFPHRWVFEDERGKTFFLMGGQRGEGAQIKTKRNLQKNDANN